MRLWLVRHAPVEAPPGQCYGRTDFAARAGATQVAAQALAARLPPGVVLHSSPLRRCRALAQALVALRPDLGAPQLDDRLAEMDFGAWEQRPWSDIPRAEIDAWTADFADARAGQHGESTRLFMARVGAAWDACRAARLQDAVWITHAGVIRAVLLLQQGVRVPAGSTDWPAQSIPFGTALEIELNA